MDLGTANSIIIHNDKIVVDEPSVVAIENKTDKLLAVGTMAHQMEGKESPGIRTIRPLRDGVIADFNAAEQMIRGMVKMVSSKRRWFSPALRMVVCIPSGSTEVEIRAVRDSSEHAGGRDVYMIYEPMAAALGIGLDVEAPEGNMIVDIGGGSTEIAVISLGGIVASRSVRMGGNRLDMAIVNYIRTVYNVSLGEYTAEELKIGLGSVYPMQNESRATVRGIDIERHLPTTIEISSQDVYEALREPVMAIIDAIHQTLEDTPPELSADIMIRGITLTGGGAQLLGLDALIHSETGIPAHVSKNPLDAVVMGAGRIVDDPATMRLIDAARA